jgi:thioredoxin-related protein
MILLTLLILIAVVAGLLGWFCYKLVFRLNFVSNNLVELYRRLDEFDQHIKFIYELEMYYGDETLKNLIRHSRDLRNYMKKYQDVMELLEEEQQIIEEEPDDEDESSENNEEKEKFASPAGKTVFYPGT